MKMNAKINNNKSSVKKHSLNAFNPYPVLGVYMTPIDFFLINKNGSLRLSGIKFCDFSYII